MLELLDKLDGEYNRINNLGRWTKHENPQILALTATISTLQSQLNSLKGQNSTLQSFIAKTKTPPIPNPSDSTKLQKPPPKKEGESEIIEYKGYTWKWCGKCFDGSWNRTHVTSEYVIGAGKRNHHHQYDSDSKKIPMPAANLVETQSGITPTTDASDDAANQANLSSSSTLDFL
jgi:hypothetical protein